MINAYANVFGENSIFVVDFETIIKGTIIKGHEPGIEIFDNNKTISTKALQLKDNYSKDDKILEFLRRLYGSRVGNKVASSSRMMAPVLRSKEKNVRYKTKLLPQIPKTNFIDRHIRASMFY